MVKTKKNRIFIFHFLPIELYPPAINFASYLSKNIQVHNTEVILITTKAETELSLVEIPNIRIIRYRGIENGMSVFKKILQYIVIYGAVIFKLFKDRPQSIFYYESLSALPFVVYSFFYKRMNLYIHYHELFTLEQLKKGRTLHKILNIFEGKFLYAKAKWISQTNVQRMKIFLDQYHLVHSSSKHKTLPNYPPEKWINGLKDDCSGINVEHKVKLLHIGALSFDSLYLNEILEHYGNNENFEITFYSHLSDQNIIERLKSYKNVLYKGSINYVDIPKLKGLYDVGLVLYKGKSFNVIYSAPNKIFEYLALGVDVWCSDKLLTAKDYQIKNSYPKMLSVNFENLPAFNFEKAFDKTGLIYKKSPYYSEAVYKPLVDLIKNDFIVKKS